MTTLRNDPTARPKTAQSRISTPSGGIDYPAAPHAMAANHTVTDRRTR
jgi:hypothetical protein